LLPPIPAWDANPKDAADWKTLISTLGDQTATATVEMQEKLGVITEPTVIDGVRAFILTPKVIAKENQNRLLLNIHGGGYVYNPGVAGTEEATSMAAYGGFKIISIDYRMPPDHPYPAGLDDCLKVWRAIAQTNDPKKLGLFGSSAGAGMVLAMILRAKDEGLPFPAALAVGTPWVDLTETGDTYRTNEWLDNVLVSYRGYLGRAAREVENAWHERRFSRTDGHKVGVRGVPAMGWPNRRAILGLMPPTEIVLRLRNEAPERLRE
jgi:acetyl esterase/lipase